MIDTARSISGISILAPVRRRRQCANGYGSGQYFNSRPREEASSCRRPPEPSFHFNSRPREEASEKVAKEIRSKKYFNSRPREEASKSPSPDSVSKTYFNSRPREEASQPRPRVVRRR